MIAGLDSSYDAPNAAQADAAAAGGVRLWSGYLALPGGGAGLAAPWPREAFENARLCGGAPIAFCSGWDDPVALRELASEWGVRLCLDCEPGIRDLGDWTQPWLDASGAGLYGGRVRHQLRAAFHILAEYPGFDPLASWSGLRPADGTPCGWQWRGDHVEFGAHVDRGWYDDGFSGGWKVVLGPDDVKAITDAIVAEFSPTGRLKWLADYTTLLVQEVNNGVATPRPVDATQGLSVRLDQLAIDIQELEPMTQSELEVALAKALAALLARATPPPA